MDPRTARVSVAFGDFVLDSDARLLLCGGRPINLTPKAFQLLELLVRRRPAGVSKAEIHDLLWPRTFVSEGNIARLMFEVRAALGDDAGEPRYLRTLRGFGYAFADSPARPAETTGPVHRLVWRDRSATLQAGDNVLGRGPGATVWVDAPGVSRRHALIRVEDGSAVLTDLDSKNGTGVVGRDERGPLTLRDGDEIRLGDERIRYRMVTASASTRTATRRR
jgi:DNA-binding winged helix-turn-helix (wHTH) protein